MRASNAALYRTHANDVHPWKAAGPVGEALTFHPEVLYFEVLYVTLTDPDPDEA